MKQVCDMIINLVSNFDQIDLNNILAKNQSRQLRLAKKRVKDLLHQLTIQRNIVAKLTNEVDSSASGSEHDDMDSPVILFKRNRR